MQWGWIGQNPLITNPMCYTKPGEMRWGFHCCEVCAAEYVVLATYGARKPEMMLSESIPFPFERRYLR